MWPKDRTATLKLFNVSIVTTVERILFQHTTAAGKKNTCHNWLLCVFDAGRGVVALLRVVRSINAVV